MRISLVATARRFARWEFVPEAVLFAGLTAFFLHQNDAATSAFKSTKAVAIMAVVAIGWLGARLLLARFVRFAVARAAVFSLAAAVALSVVVFPAYDNKTVVETFPTAAAAPAPPAATETQPMPPAPAELAEPLPTRPAPAVTPKKTAPAPPTSTTMAIAPAGATERRASPPATTSPAQPEVAATTPAEPAPAPFPVASGPQRLRAGALHGIDHRASGTAAVYRQPAGRFVIGLEDIDIQPGPDYDLYVVPGADRRDTKGGIRLDDLRGNRGTQFYDVPTGVDLEAGPWTVLVWCQTFAVPVANATPS